MSTFQLVTKFPQPVSSQTFSADFAQQLVNEINSVRANPSLYVSYLSMYPDYPLSEKQETERFLRLQPPCNRMLRLNPLLSQLSQAWVNAQGPRGDTGHGDFAGRLRQANIPLVSGSYTVAENIAYGFTSPRDIIMAWIVDFGVPGKGHRMNLFRCDFDQIGIGYGPHATFRNMVVNVYGSGFASSR